MPFNLKLWLRRAPYLSNLNSDCYFPLAWKNAMFSIKTILFDLIHIKTCIWFFNAKSTFYANATTFQENCFVIFYDFVSHSIRPNITKKWFKSSVIRQKYVCVSGGFEMFVFWKIWWASFSQNTHFEIGLFALLSPKLHWHQYVIPRKYHEDYALHISLPPSKKFWLITKWGE